MIVDISCDLRSESNPLPIYAHSTSFDQPVTRLIDRKGVKPLDLIAIPTLPQLIPKQVAPSLLPSIRCSAAVLDAWPVCLQSTEDFSQQLLPHLIALGRDSSEPFRRARSAFDEATVPLRPTCCAKPPTAGGWAASAAQQRLYWLEVGYARSQASAGRAVAAGYNAQAAVPLQAATSAADVRASFAALLRTHAAARTSFSLSGAEGGAVTAAIAGECAADVSEVEGPLEDVALRELLAPFDLSTPPLMRVAVVSTAGGSKDLLITAHQAVLDERSLRRIAGMWQKPGASIDTDEVTFVDYTSWMQARADGVKPGPMRSRARCRACRCRRSHMPVLVPCGKGCDACVSLQNRFGPASPASAEQLRTWKAIIAGTCAQIQAPRPPTRPTACAHLLSRPASLATSHPPAAICCTTLPSAKPVARSE